MKNILIVSPHFYPEDFKCNDVAFELARLGYNVTVLSDIPNYPGGRFFDGYGLFQRRREIVKGVKVIRTAVIPRRSGSGMMLALNYLSFALTACFRAFFMGLFNKYDVVLVHETSPVTVGLPAVIIKKMQKKVRMFFWVLDLWPESLQAVGKVNNKLLLRTFEKIAKLCYANSEKILIGSRGFERSICEKGDFSNKIIYFPNWAEEALTLSDNYVLPKFPEGFMILFAGNIGEAQDFENTLEAIKILHQAGESRIHLVLVGDGRKRQWVDDYVERNSLGDMVHLVGRHPIETMGLFFAKADVLYLSLKDSMIFNLTCPAKLQAYLSIGKPVLAMVNGECARIISEASCGCTVNAGDSQSLADSMLKMSKMSKSDLSAMGNNGREYCENHFSFKQNIKILRSLIDEE